MNALQQDAGIGAIGCFFADTRDNLERIMPSTFDYAFDAWVVTHVDLFKSARIKIVFDFLVEKIEEDKMKFAGTYSGKV